MRKTYFISDLHLSEEHPKITQAFFNFLSQHINADVDALYILGDFFEVWIGDDEQSPLAIEVANKLNAVSQVGVKVFFIHGNRDFLLGTRYAKQAGFELLPEQQVIDLYGASTVILHGDEMCTQDIAYQKFRKKSRGWWWPRLILSLPLSVRRNIARNGRAKSKAKQMNQTTDILDVTQSAVIAMFEQNQVEHMIHGHTHRPDVHHYKHNNKTLTRTVLGDWYSQGSYLVVNEHGEHTLVKDAPA
ncbi:UDP-2,3-diacylglucosamine hydrolase [Pseudoalteromonas holothuriae]|uniref:UDP-2,3-diacylglucosamine hydrolase n=1 Tax=Pseudoalteromonas holothuriae TaxID=2963714 RepID=A0A9W4QRY6_9GAMM|nr:MULTISPECIES: UDP-2,3-diacylglucosamine diphosphatase [unclassified Pseudoalteromonas]CAH9050618.1 UDP-2,3-diacylglucosamine hydrolase [Pseudoalteromonas sp. CIP111854]CAH9059610.1 UDP-2,3-diacylglucosamine hydrolase [Pseudoalteromonas sp. CIP111951]